MISNSVTTVPFGSATSVRHSLRQPFFEIAVLEKNAFSLVEDLQKNKLKGALSDILKTEDNYIDNDKIT